MFKVIRRAIIIFAVLLAVLAVDLLQCGTGVVPTITVAEKSGDTLELQMTYVLPMGGYSAHNVAADGVEHTSNGFVLYIGSDSPIHRRNREYKAGWHFGNDQNSHRNWLNIVEKGHLLRCLSFL